MAVTNNELVQSVLSDISPIWANRINSAQNQTWEQRKLMISSPIYEQGRNEIFNALVNRIIMTTVHDLNVNNPLSVFKDGDLMMYGNALQEMGTDIITSREFKGVDQPVDQFAVNLPKVAAAYHLVNRESQYTITIPDERLNRAFIDEYGVERLVGAFIDSLYKSNTVDEYIYAKKCFRDVFEGKVDLPLKDKQILKIPDLTSEDLSNEDIRKGIIRIRNVVSDMAQNKSEYNQMGRTIATSKSDLICLLNLKAVNQNEVQNLSGLYNPEYNSLGVEILEVDNFENDSLLGVICDRKYLQIRTNSESTTQAANAASHYVNYFYTLFQTYSVSPFQSAVFLAKE